MAAAGPAHLLKTSSDLNMACRAAVRFLATAMAATGFF
jgi:hypothetical protein